MSALLHEVSACPCGSAHKCACGCGQELNPNLRRIHELAASGASTSQTAALLDVSATFVKRVKNGQYDPKYLVGHHRLTREQYEETKRRNAELRDSRVRAHEKSVLRYCLSKIAAGDVRWAYKTRGGCAEVFRRHLPDHPVARLAEARARQRAADEAAKKVRAEARARQRAANRGRWKPSMPRPYSLDAAATLADHDGSELYDYALTRASVAADPANILLQDEAAAALRRIVGDMAPEDVQRMTAWDLDRLRDRLAAAGLVPLGVQEAERDRLRDPQRKTGEFVKQAKGGGGKRSRKAQQQVTRDHHVRELSQRQKQAHKQRRDIRHTHSDERD